jgi:AcrR family transcriptional regulator
MAGRRRSIDREQVLDLAEAIVSEKGPAALTIDAVAKAAGITKGGVQYCFGSKDQLLDKMYERWMNDFEARVSAIAGENPDPPTAMRAYVAAGRGEFNAKSWSRSSVMLSLLMLQPGRLAQYWKVNQTRLDALDLSTEEGRSLALAFVASEGAFFLRGFKVLEFSEATWDALTNQIVSILERSSRELPDSKKARGK